MQLGAGRFPAQAGGGGLGVGADAGAGDAYHRPEATDGELGRWPALEAAEAAKLLDRLCLLWTPVPHQRCWKSPDKLGHDQCKTLGSCPSPSWETDG